MKYLTKGFIGFFVLLSIPWLWSYVHTQVPDVYRFAIIASGSMSFFGALMYTVSCFVDANFE